MRTILENIENNLLTGFLIGQDREGMEQEHIENIAEEMFQNDCKGIYTADTIREAIDECDDELLEKSFNTKRMLDVGYSIRQIVAEYWSDYYLHQAEAQWETEKAEALSEFLCEKYGHAKRF